MPPLRLALQHAIALDLSTEMRDRSLAALELHALLRLIENLVALRERQTGQEPHFTFVLPLFRPCRDLAADEDGENVWRVVGRKWHADDISDSVASVIKADACFARFPPQGLREYADEPQTSSTPSLGARSGQSRFARKRI